MRNFILAITLLLGLSIEAKADMIAPHSYGDAYHYTDRWQTIASSSNNKITDPYGISWSSDNGSTWGRDAIEAGSDLIFKLSMFKKVTGNHYADHAKMWLDWNNDGIFTENESILYGEQLLSENERGNYGQTIPRVRSYEFLSEPMHIGHEHTGKELWLRGRVVCSESLIGSIGGWWYDQFDHRNKDIYKGIFSPSRYYYQGQKEDWMLTVNQPKAEVYNTGSMVLLVIGCIALFRRKFLKV